MFDKSRIDLDNIENSYDYIIECLNRVYIKRIIEYLIENGVDLNIVFDYLDNNNIDIKYNVVAMILIEHRYEGLIKKYFNFF